MKVVINTVVWGDKYIDTYLRYSIPSLMSDGNFLDPLVQEAITLQIMSTESGFKRMGHDPIYSRLKNLLKVEELSIPDINMVGKEDTYKYDRVSDCQYSAIKLGVKNDADVMFFLYPDFIFSCGSLRKIFQKMTVECYHAVFCPIPFISHDKVEDGLFRKSGFERLSADGFEISLPTRGLVRLNIESPHPVNLGFDFLGDRYGEWPGCFVWNIEGEGQLIRSFHLHPIGINLKSPNTKIVQQFKNSLDDEYVSKVFSSDDNLYFVRDSDEFSICSLRYEADPPHIYPGNRSDLRRTLLWAEEHTSSLLRYFLGKEFLWHYADLRDPKWIECRQQADTFFEKVMDCLTAPDSLIEYEDPALLLARKNRVKRGY